MRVENTLEVRHSARAPKPVQNSLHSALSLPGLQCHTALPLQELTNAAPGTAQEKIIMTYLSDPITAATVGGGSVEVRVCHLMKRSNCLLSAARLVGRRPVRRGGMPGTPIAEAAEQLSKLAVWSAH